MNRRRVLLDENLPVRLRQWLTDVEATTVEFMGWKGARNGELVRLARAELFAALVTADRALALGPRSWAPLGCVHVTSNGAARLQAAAPRIGEACRTVLPGQVVTVRV
jgi:predicted nuclease of predicted toxin-antitoxin system